MSNTTAGTAGLMHTDDGATQTFSNFELRRSPELVTDEHLERKLYDARGVYRGEMKGSRQEIYDAFMGVSSWDEFGREKIILLDAYRPERSPYPRDWVLVLEKQR
ncbi:MAG: hypothetical protein HY508_14680 [Acidobacteria bacterium]|nr:hypothetical protein [Acidobacteriota bacterium]